MHVAPVVSGCAVCSLPYTHRVLAIFLTLHYAKYIHKRFIKNRRNKLHSHIHTMIGTCLVLMYYGYLYITRTTLDIFNCGPTVPDDGFEYMEAVFIKCYEDPLHKLLFPWAVLQCYRCSLGMLQ